MKARVILILTAFLLWGQATAQKAPQWGNLKPGPYTVGYKTLRINDITRHYFGNVRPLQIYVWYPATVQKGEQQMHFKDYFNDAAYDWGSEAKTVEGLRKYLLRDFRISALSPSYPAGLPDSTFNSIMDTPIPVYREATLSKEKFPVLLHLHSNGALSQSVMLEYLASNGYVVMSVSSYGSSPLFYGRGEDGNNALLNQTLDLSIVLAEAKKLPFADADNAAMVGMMAQAGLSLQMKEMPLKAIACLDCNWNATEIKKLPYYEVKRVRIPMMEVVNTDFAPQQTSFLDSLPYAERFIGRFHVFPYADFFPFPKIARPAESHGFTNYEYLSVFTLKFLNGIFKTDAASKTFRENPSAGDKTDWPAGYLFIRKKAALPPMPAEDEFLGWLRYNDMVKAREAWKTYGKSLLPAADKLFFVTLFLVRDGEPNALEAVKMFAETSPADRRLPGLLTRLGREYLDHQQYDLSLEVFGLYAKEFPLSPYAYNGLADTYVGMGDLAKAKEQAKKTLEILKQSIIPKEERAFLTNNAETILSLK